MDALAERAASIAQKARALTPKDAAQLTKALDRSIVREWYHVKMPNGVVREVFFCPPQTHAEVMTVWYPGCGVTPC